MINPINMFVSYSFYREDKLEYGYMCLCGKITDENLLLLLKDRLFVKEVTILHKCKYDWYNNHYVYIHTDGVHKIIKYDKPLNDVEGVGNLYSYLYDKCGFTNILGFHPIED